MARKRSAKRRKQSQKSVDLTESQGSNHRQSPSDASRTAPTLSPNSSYDGTLSDGVQTAMTSFMDTDEETTVDPTTANTATTSEPDDSDYRDVDYDGASMYPRSQYPQVSFEHRSEEPWRGSEVNGGSDAAASTRSLWAQDLDYRELHGRRYCRDYFMPNDDMEQLRMTLLHRVYLHVLNNELTTVPLNNPEHILDIGTGTGEWAIRVAELFPLCEVVGTDISATAETQGVPMNVFFEVEDAEEWERLPDLYDLIHFRDMEGAFSDWAAMYANVYYSLKPGGYVEVQDFDSVDGLSKFIAQFSPDSSVHALQRDLLLASEKAGRIRGTSHMHPRVFLDAGFVDVRATEYAIPISVAEKTAGKIWLIACLDAWEATCLRLLTEQMDWDPDECKAACEEAARELANLAKDPEKSKGLQVKMVVVTARKPVDAPPSLTPQACPSSSPSVRSQIEDTPGRNAARASREPSPFAMDANGPGQAREPLST